MTDAVCSEFATFLYLLMDSNGCRYLDDAKRLMKCVKDASEEGLKEYDRKSRIGDLSDYCRNLVRRLEADGQDYRYRIPLAVREMGLSTIDQPIKLILLGNFALAVLRFERPERTRFRPSDSPPSS